MYILVLAMVLAVAHPAAKTRRLAAIQQTPARSARVEKWLTTPTPITLSSDQRRRVDSVKISYDQRWRHMLDVLKKDGDRMAFTMKALQWDTQIPKSIQKILTPPQRTTFEANYVAVEGRQP